MSHDTHTTVKLQVSQALKFVSALKSRLGARAAGEREINWTV